MFAEPGRVVDYSGLLFHEFEREKNNKWCNSGFFKEGGALVRNKFNIVSCFSFFFRTYYLACFRKQKDI